jgi:hypothetical protein
MAAAWERERNRSLISSWFRRFTGNAPQHLGDEFLHCRGTVRSKTVPHREDDIRRWREKMAIETKKLPDNPFNPVPAYR